MNPIPFGEQNTVYAERQPEYIPLPAHKDADGLVTTCWKLCFWEKMLILMEGKIWLQVLTFNKPLQPLRMTAIEPKRRATEEGK